MTIDRGPQDEGPTVLTPLLATPLKRHTHDPQAAAFHRTGAHLQPHNHVIVESWKVDEKNILAMHIDRWHA